MKNDDYLWDRSGPADEEIAALEHLLGEHRFQVSRAPRRTLVTLVAIAAAAVALLGATWWWLDSLAARLPASAPYGLEVVAGTPRVDGAAAGDELAIGQRIVCDDESLVSLSVGGIGTVQLKPGTILRAVEPDALNEGARYALALERGRIQASIFAAPRVFQVGTPAGIAVDMGCVYTASVNEDGRTLLSVDAGVVAFETEGRRAVVPAGASTWAEPGRGPAIPCWGGDEDGLRAALDALDAGHGDLDTVLTLLAGSVLDTSLVLWHLVAFPDANVRAAAYDMLALFAPPPADVSREACLRGERAALDRWRSTLDWSW